MKKISLFMAVMSLSLGLVACSNAGNAEAGNNAEVSNKTETAAQQSVDGVASTEETTEETKTPSVVTVTSINAKEEEEQVEVPFNPQKIVTLDAASLDILSNLGVTDRVVASITPEPYLESYVTQAVNVGTAKTFDLEAILETEPDVIFMSGRGSDYYEDLTGIAPVVRLMVSGNVVQGTYDNAMTIASIFGMEEQMQEKLSAYDERIAALQRFAEGKNAIVGICTGGGFNVLGNDGRCSIIGRELGFNNIGVDAENETSAHGNEASFEFVVEKNPEFIFVLDRDKATNAEGAKLAQEIMENELIMSLDAYKNGNMVIMENAGVWYKAEGGFTALGIMLEDLEKELLK